MTDTDPTLEHLAGRGSADADNGVARVDGLLGRLARSRFEAALRTQDAEPINELQRARVLAAARRLPGRSNTRWFSTLGAGVSGLAAGVIGAVMLWGPATQKSDFGDITSTQAVFGEGSKSIGDGPAVSYRVVSRDLTATAEAFARALTLGQVSYSVRYTGAESVTFTVQPLDPVPKPLEDAARSMGIVIPTGAILRVEVVRE